MIKSTKMNEPNDSNDRDSSTDINSNDDNSATFPLLIAKSVSSLAKLVKDLQNQMKQIQEEINLLQTEREKDKVNENNGGSERRGGEEDIRRQRDFIKAYKSILSIIKVMKIVLPEVEKKAINNDEVGSIQNYPRREQNDNQEGEDSAKSSDNTMLLRNIAQTISDFDDCCSLISSSSLLTSPQTDSGNFPQSNTRSSTIVEFKSIPDNLVPITPASTRSMESVSPQQEVLQHRSVGENATTDTLGGKDNLCNDVSNNITAYRNSNGKMIITQQHEMEEYLRNFLSQSQQSKKHFVYIHFCMTIICCLLVSYCIMVHFELSPQTLLSHGRIYFSNLKHGIDEDEHARNSTDHNRSRNTTTSTMTNASTITYTPPFLVTLEENTCATKNVYDFQEKYVVTTRRNHGTCKISPRGFQSNTRNIINERLPNKESNKNQYDEKDGKGSDHIAQIDGIKLEEKPIKKVFTVTPIPEIPQVQRKETDFRSIPRNKKHADYKRKHNRNVQIVSEAHLCSSFEDSAIISTVSLCHGTTALQLGEAKRRKEQKERALSELRENKYLRRMLFQKQFITALIVGGMVLFPQYFSFGQIQKFIFQMMKLG